MMYVKIHKNQDREILAVCDEDILGKTFEEGDLQIKISEVFYKGEKKSEKDTLDLINHFDNISLVGVKTIKLALDNELIEESSIIIINGIPHVQIYNL